MLKLTLTLTLANPIKRRKHAWRLLDVETGVEWDVQSPA